MRPAAIIIIVIILGLLGGSVLLRGPDEGNPNQPENTIPTPGEYTEKPLSLGTIPINSSGAPILETISSVCNVKPQNTLTWQPVSATSEYIINRSNIAIGRVSATTYIDMGLDLPQGLISGVEYCYTVQSVTRGEASGERPVISSPSNIKCVVTSSCGGITPGEPTPTPTLPDISTPTPTGTLTPTPSTKPTKTPTPTKAPTPTGTLTPTPSTKPTKTPTPGPTSTPTPTTKPADPRCTSTTLYNGKPVISVKTFDNNIQQTLDCFKDPNTGGGAVYVPQGNYPITKKVGIYSNVTIFGDGMDRTVITLSGTNESGMGNDSSRGQTNITIRDLTLKGPGNRGGTCCHGLKLENLTNGFVIDVAADNWGLDGIYMGYKLVSGSLKGAVNIRVTGCRANNNDRNGLSLTHGTGNVIDKCSLSGNNADPAKRASAIDLEPDSGGNTSDNIIRDNTLTSNKGNGIGLGPNPNEPGPKGTVQNNAVCFNTTKNNDFAGIHAYKGNIFVENDLQNDDGFQTIDCGGSSGCATGPKSACSIPSALNSLPQKPSQVQGILPIQEFGGVLSPILNFFYQFFGGE